MKSLDVHVGAGRVPFAHAGVTCFQVAPGEF